MPVVNSVSLKLETGEIMRRQGFSGRGEVKPEIERVVHELINEVANYDLLKPAITYRIFTAEEMDKKQFSITAASYMCSRLLTSTIPGSEEIAVSVCTIGPDLEKQVTEYSCRSEALRSILLDGIGSTAVDALAREATRLIAEEVASHGYKISRPVNPGMPCLPLTEQGWLLDLVHAEDIGVSLTSSSVMVPRKSTSMVIGAGREMSPWTPADICADCGLSETCPYKYENT